MYGSGNSTRNLKRLIKQRRDKYIRNLNQAANETGMFANNNTANNNNNEQTTITNNNNNEQSIITNNNFVETESLENNENNLPYQKSLIEKLRDWYIRNRPSRQCFEELLIILREENLKVPLSAKTILQNKQKMVVRNVSPGTYCHFGIEKQLQKISNIICEHKEIVFDMNIDGLPLFKSSRVHLWPILLRIVNVKNVNVFPIGIYLGRSKPSRIEEFLSEFIDELKTLTENGIKIKNKEIKLRIRAFICDAPAKAFLCGIVGHTSVHGCSKCVQVGKKINNVLTYSSEASQLITDQDFSDRKYLNHHQKFFYTKKTPLENVNVKMISQVPLDDMHLVDLGVMRKILVRMLHNKINVKISKDNISKISKHLESLRPYIPKEFARYPRTFDEILNWKATEFRQFLLYTGILVLKDKVNDDFYYEFLLLHCACRLLACPKNYIQNIDVAQNMLELFVQNFSIIFGQNSVSYNVHGLLHLTESVKHFGALTSFSAYNFENYLHILKKNVKKPSKILEQIFNRVQGENLISEPKNNTFKEINGIIFSYSTCQYFCSIKCPDNYCFIQPHIPIKITGFKRNEQNFVIGKRLINMQSFFTEPFNSASSIGICLVDSIPSEFEESFKLEEIQCKCMCLPYEDKFLLLPILHSCY